jgi:hypothetical protein
MGDYIYAISHAGITVTNLDTMELSASVQLVTPTAFDHSSNTDGVETDETEEKADG